MTEPAVWQRLYNRIKAQIPAVPDALLREEVWNVLIDFTQDTNLWLETVSIAIQPNVLSYPFTLASGVANRLMVVYKDGDPYKNWADSNITMRVPGIIELLRAQPTAQTWWAVIAKAVQTPATTGSPPVETGYPVIDDWIVNTYSDCFYYGTMWYLQRMPAKSWRDPNAAKENANLYGSQKSMARVNGQRVNVFGGQPWRFPQSFATVARKGWT